MISRTLLNRPFGSSTATVAMMGMMALSTAWGADPSCLSYYTVGDSKCQPVASTPVKASAPKAATTPQLVPPPTEVDKFLDNYGKPPREFVEFYLNPTAENAQKWVTTYQGIIQKGQDISKAWNQADQLYKGAGSQAAQPQPALGAQAAPQEAPATPSIAAVQPVAPAVQSFGAFGNVVVSTPGASGGVRLSPVSLTYYFSQTCPYCARMTPDLAVISKEQSSKLAFTCVDVTPVGATSRPYEAFITSKLPCKWRLPEEGEVEREGVRQTPTLVIQKEGQSPVRLSGYVPLTQLRQYF